MILATLIIFILIARWQVVHLHDGYYKARPWFEQYHVGDTIYWRGCKATVIDRKTCDIVIRRHIVGLLPFWPRKR